MGKKPAVVEPDEGEELSDIAIDRLGYMARNATLEAGTLTGDLRDTMLDIIKSRPKPWSAMSEGEQQKLAAAVEYAARELVKGAVEVICGDGVIEPVKAILESYADKGDVKGVFKVKTLDDDDASFAITALHKMRGKMVLISMASHDDYLGERGAAQTEPDQHPLSFESEPAHEEDLSPADAPVAEVEEDA